MVKRVVALAGDRVGLADGRLVVNGQRQSEDYVDLASVDSVYFGPEVVPAGSVFVLGDDRADSVDSRDYGPVPLDRVLGRVLWRLW
jgi:signal peptidase I